jgi:hypothetical protein
MNSSAPTLNQHQAAAAAARRAKRQARYLRGDAALEVCEREHAWPSRIVEPYPRGTFSPPSP